MTEIVQIFSPSLIRWRLFELFLIWIPGPGQDLLRVARMHGQGAQGEAQEGHPHRYLWPGI